MVYILLWKMYTGQVILFLYTVPNNSQNEIHVAYTIYKNYRIYSETQLSTEC